MVPEKLITADCHIAPPLQIVDELPESYRQYFPRIEKDENGNNVYKPGHIVDMSMMAGDGVELDITADATGAEGNVVPRPIRAATPPSSLPTSNGTVSTERC